MILPAEKSPFHRARSAKTARPHHVFLHHVTFGFLETMGCSPGCKSSICFISVPKQLDGSRWVLRNNVVASGCQVGWSDGFLRPHWGPSYLSGWFFGGAEFETTPAVLWSNLMDKLASNLKDAKVWKDIPWVGFIWHLATKRRAKHRKQLGMQSFQVGKIHTTYMKTTATNTFSLWCK